MWGRYYNFTSCIKLSNLDTLEKEITSLIEEQFRASKLTPLPSSALLTQKSKVKNSSNQSSGFWGVGLFEGNDGWAIVKTHPWDLLCYPIKIENRHLPLLSALAVKLKCNGFHLDVYEDLFGILLEANSAGKVYISGVFDSNNPNENFYDNPIHSPDLIKQFSLLKVSSSLQLAMKANENPEIAQKKAQHARLESKKDRDIELFLELEDEAMQGYTERIDRALQKEMIESNYWYIHRLFDHDNLEFLTKESTSKNIRLFCFQSPLNFKLPQACKLSRNQWLEIYGIELPLSS
ncbi:MAG: hypothetical protein AAFQ80_06560 [Cyanobacteria bacterium J06621_8]